MSTRIDLPLHAPLLLPLARRRHHTLLPPQRFPFPHPLHPARTRRNDPLLHHPQHPLPLVNRPSNPLNMRRILPIANPPYLLLQRHLRLRSLVVRHSQRRVVLECPARDMRQSCARVHALLPFFPVARPRLGARGCRHRGVVRAAGCGRRSWRVGKVVELGSPGGRWLVGWLQLRGRGGIVVGRLGRKAVLRPTSSPICLYYSSTSISRTRNKQQRHDTTRKHTNSNGGSRRS